MRFFKVLSAFVLGICLMVNNAQAALQIEITGGRNEGRRIVVLPFGNANASPVDLQSIIEADLTRSGKFSPVNHNQIPNSVANDNSVNFDALAAAGVELVVAGQVKNIGNNNFEIVYKFVGVQGANKGKVIGNAKQLRTNDQNLRQAAHLISDRTYELLTGQPGVFRTRIAYIVYKYGDRYPYNLMTADYDGYNETSILRSTEPIMTPNWSPDGTHLVYVSFERRAPTIFIQDIYNNKNRTQLVSFKGLNSSPSWSPDGNKIAFTLSKDGQPEIYYFDLRSKALKRVTNNSAIDTEPSWSSDSQSIFFTSERGGRAQIYQADINTLEAKRVTFQGAMNLSARPIPGTDSLVVITRQNGYRVARVEQDGSLYLLTTSALDESPSVSPNGSMVIYSTVYQGRKGLALVSTDGRFKANLPSTTNGEITAPSWGPIIRN